jgi:hypothetical protein
MEFWPNCYSPGPGGLYDTDDTIDPDSDCYGSFQIHRDSATTALAYNAWTEANDDDVGIGNQPVNEPDWTFARNTNAFTVRTLRAFILP